MRGAMPYLKRGTFKPAVLQASITPPPGCMFTTAVQYGAACGLTDATPLDICWTLNVSTTTTLDPSSCQGSLSKQRCARSSIVLTIFEHQSSSTESSITCPAQTDPTYGVIVAQTSASADLDTAFSLSDSSLCGGNWFVSDNGYRCMMMRCVRACTRIA